MHRVACQLAVAVVVVAATASACGTPPQRFVDGYPIGEPVSASGGSPYLQEAFRWLEEAEPDHGPVTVAVFLPDYRTADGERILPMRSTGSSFVFVFTFPDGRIRATAVGCAGIGPVPRCAPERPMRVDSSGRLVPQRSPRPTTSPSS